MIQSLRVGISISILLGTALLLHVRSPGEAVPLRQPLDTLPNTVGTWSTVEGRLLDTRSLDVLRLTDYVMRRDQAPDGTSAWLFIAYWASQRRGAQPHSPRNCLPGTGWEPLESIRVSIALSPPYAPITVTRYVVQKGGEQQVVFYWYQSRGRAIAGELAARLDMVTSSIRWYRTDTALVRVSSPFRGDVGQVSDRLVQYIQVLYPRLGEYLPD